MKNYLVRVKNAELFDRKYLLANVYIGVQKESEENIVKRTEKYEGIESYMYMCMKGGDMLCIVKITEHVLQEVGVTQEEAWRQAEKNTFEHVQIIPLTQFIHNNFGINENVWERDKEAYILTNKEQMYGASEMLNTGVLHLLAREHHASKLLIIPSSIHEVLIRVFNDDEDIEDFSQMLRNVNESIVEPWERLEDQAFVIEL